MTNLTTLRSMSRAFQEVAESQDGIGWDEFLHGKVTKRFRTIQNAHCILTGTNITSDDWMKHFIQRLVEISHAQWLYRNFTLHHYAKGYLRQRTEKDINREVEVLLNTRTSEIPPESQYLMEIAYQPQPTLPPAYNAYWVLAMKTARTCLLNKEATQARQSTRRRGMARRPLRNLLEGVRESLYNRLLNPTRRAKRPLEATEQLTTLSPRAQTRRNRHATHGHPQTIQPTKRRREETRENGSNSLRPGRQDRGPVD